MDHTDSKVQFIQTQPAGKELRTFAVRSQLLLNLQLVGPHPQVEKDVMEPDWTLLQI